MIFDAYKIYNFDGSSITEQQIRNWEAPPNGPDGTDFNSGDPWSVDGILAYFGNIMTNFTPFNGNTEKPGNLSQYDLTYEIYGGRPIIAQWDFMTLYVEHDVLIIGYSGTGGPDAGNVAYLDPDLSKGGRYEMPYKDFVQTGNSFRWYETLRLTTNPVTPIPTPIGGGGNGGNYPLISTGGTTVFTPATNSVTYSAQSIMCPTKWQWRLIFTDINGDVIVKSLTYSDLNSVSTWNITNFTLPAGHQWNYNYFGKIPGRLELTITNSDGSISIKDMKDVIFVPSILYPGNIVFANQTVSSSHADVTAHYTVELKGDNINNGGIINFKAGQTITILPETKILPGSKVNITIDPTLQ
jgi:hypothetical protein